MSRIEGYVVVTRDGKLKKPRRSAPSIFLRKSVAQNAARNDGDSVVPIVVDLEQEPIFIRRHVL